jgi:hypothetical protein
MMKRQEKKKKSKEKKGYMRKEGVVTNGAM